jgi:hypothetical protein
MNMKNIMKHTEKILVGILMIITGSCDSFLDKHSSYQTDSDKFWTVAEDAEKGLVGCYSKLNTATWGGAKASYMSLHWEGLSDNGFCQSTLYGYYNVSKGIISASSGEILSSVWDEAYKGIAACNYLLEKMEEIPGMDVVRKNEIKGEAYFLRAFWYNELTMCYGDVPLVLSTLGYDAAAYKLGRTPKNKIMEQMYDDLDFAIVNLPQNAYTNGHAVQGTALAYKARIALYNGDYETAATCAHEVIQSNRFSLHDDYNGIFFDRQTNNPEIMFSIRYETPLNNTNLDLIYGSRFAVCVHGDLVDAYECTDGKLPAESAVFDPENPYLNRDPRLKKTIFTQGDPWGYDRVNGFGYNQGKAESLPQTGFGLRKYVDYNVNPDVTIYSEQDFVKMRYADVLLMYAEARISMTKAGQGVIDQSVLDAINKIRARAYSADYMDETSFPAITVTDPDKLETIIRRERRIELAFEGLRYYDLKRWRIAETVLPSLVDPDKKQRVFDPEKHYLWPIPQAELDMVGTDVLPQNPGY